MRPIATHDGSANGDAFKSDKSERFDARARSMIVHAYGDGRRGGPNTHYGECDLESTLPTTVADWSVDAHVKVETADYERRNTTRNRTLVFQTAGIRESGRRTDLDTRSTTKDGAVTKTTSAGQARKWVENRMTVVAAATSDHGIGL
ncbi:unnamed protein product [Macrosiphum euphorbiae]|uniref:Uncharacterized protein n=1 Tax=Macrosiphum euphorbiae TaxID=13131 RepID=A0AAV0X6Z1_9HEMI|nr:unnamed protein product [Macrosiphum euphorbiae]